MGESKTQSVLLNEPCHLAAIMTPCLILFLGGKYRARTCDPLLVRQMLSQLS